MPTRPQKRNVIISVRVTPEEYDRIAKHVRQRGSNPSLYAYLLLLRDVDDDQRGRRDAAVR